MNQTFRCQRGYLNRQGGRIIYHKLRRLTHLSCSTQRRFRTMRENLKLIGAFWPHDHQQSVDLYSCSVNDVIMPRPGVNLLINTVISHCVFSSELAQCSNTITIVYSDSWDAEEKKGQWRKGGGKQQRRRRRVCHKATTGKNE